MTTKSRIDIVAQHQDVPVAVLAARLGLTRKQVHNARWAARQRAARGGVSRADLCALAWPDDDVRVLRKLWGTPGHSASVIGRILKRTRNQVIGKAYRLGLPRLASGHAAPSRQRPAPEATGVREPRP
jgi:hypothetical protein